MRPNGESLQQVRERLASSLLATLPTYPCLLLEAEDRRIYDATEPAVQFFGYPREELLKKRLYDLTVASPEAVEAELVRAQGPTPFVLEVRTANGELRLITGGYQEFPEAQLLYLLFADQTDLHLARRLLTNLTRATGRLSGLEYLHELARQLATTLNARYAYVGKLAAPDRVQGLVLWADGGFQTPSEYELSGTPCENVITKSACLFPHGVRDLFPEDPELQQLQVESYIGTPLRTKDGKPLGILWVCDTRPMPDMPVLTEILLAIAERASAELERLQLDEELRIVREQLIQAQRMESIGQMAGGIAHDFNNLLTAILGNIEMAQSALPEENPAQKYLADAIKAIEKASEFTRLLLTFARRQPMNLQTVNLNSIVLESLTLAQRWLPSNITVRTELSESLWLIEADPTQLNQVLQNLLLNAREAMPNGGVLTIETSNVVIDEEYARAHYEVIPGDYVLLAVSDTGEGMLPEVRKRIFEPFFSTRTERQGSGLGLAVVYGIVKQLGGHIWVYSERGKGTTFKLYFPRAVSEALLAVEPAPPTEVRPGTETLLLVEDEEEVRIVACEALRLLGYQVLEASSPSEALQIAESHTDTLHLLLTDVVLPLMSGVELAELIKRLHPEIRVLYVSGYTENVIVRYGVLDAGIHFLPKPYTPSQLAQKVRQVLDESP